MRRAGLAVLLALGLACQPSGAPPGSQVATATSALVRSLGLTAASQVYVVRDPYPSGRTLRVRPEFGDGATYVTDGETRFFMIDDAPTERFGHPVRYAFVGPGGKPQVTDQLWLATIDDAARWQLEDVFTADGGVLAGVLTPVPAGSSRMQLPGPAQALVAGLSSTRADAKPASQSPTGKKVALVIDGGDSLITVSPRLSQEERHKRLGRIALRDKMADESDNVKVVLERQGYTVQRFSGSITNPNPAADPETVRQAILRAKAALKPGDELVLYLDSHGVPVEGPGKKPIDGLGIQLCAKTGACGLLTYGQLASWLGELDPGLKKVVALDACFAGGAIGPLSKVSGTQVFAASAKDKTATGGTGSEENFTDTFLKTPGDRSIEERLTAAAKQHPNTGAVVSLGEGLFGGRLPTLPPTPTPTPSATASATSGASPTARVTLAPITSAPATTAPVATTAPPRSTSTITPAGQLTGTWRGGIASTGYFDGQVFCKWTGSITIELMQTGNALAGTAKLAWRTGVPQKTYANCQLNPEEYGLVGTVSGSAVSFQFTGGQGGWFGTARGSVTTDLMYATFSGSGSDYGAGCIQVSRAGVGALPSCN